MSDTSKQPKTLEGPSVGLSAMTPDILQAWQTPKAMQVQNSECPVVGSKFYQLTNEESHHTKWEEFRKMAQSANSEDCSILLRKMELDDSESDNESAKSILAQDEEVLSLGDLLPSDVNARIVGFQAMVVPRSKPRGEMGDVRPDANPATSEAKLHRRKWGPMLMMDRPRRVPEDGRTMLQKAQDLKKVKNMETGIIQKTFFCF